MCPYCWENNLIIRLERGGINNETDNEGGDNAKVRGEGVRIRRELQGASAVTLVCESRELVPQS